MKTTIKSRIVHAVRILWMGFRLSWKVLEKSCHPFGIRKNVGSRKTNTVPTEFSSFSPNVTWKENSNQQNHVFILGLKRHKRLKQPQEIPMTREVLGKGERQKCEDVCKISVHYGQPPDAPDAQLLGKGRWWCEHPWQWGGWRFQHEQTQVDVSKLNLSPQVVFLAWSSAKSYEKASL